MCESTGFFTISGLDAKETSTDETATRTCAYGAEEMGVGDAEGGAGAFIGLLVSTREDGVW